MRRGWPDPGVEKAEIPRLRSGVRLEGVTFAYEPGCPVLRFVDLVVDPGERVALVGGPGSGKTTLLGLVAGLHNPAEGVVHIAGRDVRTLSAEDLRDEISFVPRDGVVFAGVSHEIAADDDVSRSARFKTIVGEHGATLSGGWPQALAVATALVGNAPIVLLDEPTASLEPESEELALTALDRVLERRTVLVATRRAAVIRRADSIAVLEGGRIVERGRPDELLAQRGRYPALEEDEPEGSVSGFVADL